MCTQVLFRAGYVLPTRVWHRVPGPSIYHSFQSRGGQNSLYFILGIFQKWNGLDPRKQMHQIKNKTKGLMLHRHDLSIKTQNKEIYPHTQKYAKNMKLYPIFQKYTKKLKI